MTTYHDPVVYAEIKVQAFVSANTFSLIYNVTHLLADSSLRF